jgi:hypothetical protein
MKHTGRPTKKVTLPRLPRAEEINLDSTFSIDKVELMLDNLRVPTSSDIEKGMIKRLIHECENLQKVTKEMDSLAEAYNRYVDLRNEQIRREKRMERIMAVIGNKGLEDAMSTTKNQGDSVALSYKMVDVDALREDLSVWEAMKEYLHYVPEARIPEIEDFFIGALGVNLTSVNRASIDSALKRHPETFRVRKQKREKLISLKENARD